MVVESRYFAASRANHASTTLKKFSRFKTSQVSPAARGSTSVLDIL